MIKPSFVAAGLVLFCMALASAAALGQAGKHGSPTRPSSVLRVPAPQAILHSHQPDGAVVIPFRTRYERACVTTVHHKRHLKRAVFTKAIFVNVRVGSKVMTAMVDTGFADSVWPADLKLGHISLQNVETITDDGGNITTAGLSILKRVRVGGLELKNLHTYGINQAREDTEQNPEDQNVLVLGDTAFADVVLTIDYCKKELILHPAGFHPPKWALIYPCVWSDKDDTTGVGVPAIWGTIEGQKALGIFDTGWNSDDIGLSPQMYQKLLPTFRLHKTVRTPWTDHAAFGKASSTDIQRIHWALPGVEFKGDAVAVASLQPRVDMVLGFGLLAGMRVTIDYPGRRLWIDMISSK